MTEAEGPRSEASDQEADSPGVTVLTVNQLVAYNLMRARRSKGWTQAEASVRVMEAGGRPWTPAAISAAERSWETGRPKEFDANELLSFARAFEQPVSYFFLPIPRGIDGGERCVYSLKKIHPRLDVTTVTDEVVLDTAVPLRYPPSFVQEVNNRLREQGLFWSPSAEIDWYRPEEQDEGYEAMLKQAATEEADGDEGEIDAGAADRREEALARFAEELLDSLSSRGIKFLLPDGSVIGERPSRKRDVRTDDPPF
ncbi:helix-turn-helix transcriptional regulator [Streptomyces sp. ATCC 21386]|uniref:helix-turn-helix domain-containing protein n=1 Tax=Streptomyces sp. ATCC 21386 TaxID=2699428 RepID=UPI001BFFB7C5|nr:helix-turn-helix transcriptional regulator [Streptomyces sp. ATCC 21386]